MAAAQAPWFPAFLRTIRPDLPRGLHLGQEPKATYYLPPTLQAELIPGEGGNSDRLREGPVARLKAQRKGRNREAMPI